MIAYVIFAYAAGLALLNGYAFLLELQARRAQIVCRKRIENGGKP